MRLFSNTNLCDGLKIVHHNLSTTHEVESPMRDPVEGVYQWQTVKRNWPITFWYILVYKALHSTVQ